MDKHRTGVHIEKNALVDKGDGTIQFPDGLVITDDSVQKNGTRYDIPSMVLDEYKGQITADHVDMLQAVIGKVTNIYKQGNRVLIDGIKFAVKENALAKLAYDLITNNFVTDFSIETYGPPTDEEGVYYGARLVGLSAVVVGNNNSATINEFAINSIKQAKKDGLDTSELEKVYKQKPAKNNISNKENEMAEAKKSEQKAEKVENKAEVKTEATPAFDASSITEAIKNGIAEAVKPLSEKVEGLEKNAFDKSAKEPEFTKSKSKVVSEKNELGAMDWEDRTAEQIENARVALRTGNAEASKKLNSINEFHLGELKKDGIVKNTLTIADFGNFVISPELISEIQGCRNDYTPLVEATNWRETLSTQMAWLNRSGDIDMTSVEFCDDDADGNLKPISEYTATIRTANLEELAAVTPVCNAATRFLAADLLGDVAAGYRNDYDRKRAQLVIARLEQAVEANGNSVIYDTNPSVDAVNSLLSTWAEIATCTPNGVFVMNVSSYAQFVKTAVAAGVSGPLAQLVTTGNQQTIFGRPYILVSDDLLPTLNVAETKSIVVDGVTVTVNHAVFYFNPSNFTGRISGGLQYDLSTDAAYEVGEAVRSAYQRNELVLRGSFFRGGAILDNNQVAGLLAPGAS